MDGTGILTRSWAKYRPSKHILERKQSNNFRVYPCSMGCARCLTRRKCSQGLYILCPPSNCNSFNSKEGGSRLLARTRTSRTILVYRYTLQMVMPKGNTYVTWYVSGSLFPVADSHMYTCPSLLAVNTIRSRSFHTIDLSSSVAQYRTEAQTPLH